MYSTAISPAYTYGLMHALDKLIDAESKRKQLNALISDFNEKKALTHFTWRHSSSPIQQLQLGCPHKAIACSEFLKKKKILCLPMRQPTVSRKESGLRVVLNVHHTPEEIDLLMAGIEEYGNNFL